MVATDTTPMAATGTTEATGITPTEATTVDIGAVAIMADAIMAPAIIPTTHPSLLDCRSRFLSRSRFRNDYQEVRVQDQDGCTWGILLKIKFSAFPFCNS
jgi:hypothetical protein